MGSLRQRNVASPGPGFRGVLCGLLGCLFISTQAGAATAASGGRGSFGLMTGLALPSSGDQAFLLGFKVEYHLLTFMKTAVFFDTFGSSVNSAVDASSVAANTRTSLYGLESAINLDQDVSVGLKLGIVRNSSEVRASDGHSNSVGFSSSASGLFVGPTLQYEQPLGRFAMTAELAYALAFSSDVPKAVLLSIGVKYLF